MKADRLLSVLLLLQAKGRATERELAERLEVSQRTVHRDLESLSASGVPVLALRGASGGWELEKGWRTQVPGLNAPELQALLMVQPRGLGHPRLAAAAESALNKLMAALPASLQQQAAAMRERLHVDAKGWWDAGEDVSILPEVQEAVASERKLAFDYLRADGQEGPRTVDPLGLVAKGAGWYLVARTPRGMRTYRVSRMKNVTALAGTFKRPARFDLAAYWRRSTAELENQRGKFPAILEVTEAAAKKLMAWCTAGPVCENEVRHDAREGWVRVRAEFDYAEQARFVILGLGAKARVIRPAELRAAIEAEVREAAAMHAAASQV
jgi:predicted DNA-binding transcriptional regulator YafY